MKTFRDTAGREWTLSINVGSLARVMDATKIDLTKALSVEAIDEQLANVLTMFDVLCVLLAAQLDQRGVTREQLGEALDEEAAEKAVIALYEAVIDFFRGPKREAMGRAFRKTVEAGMAQRNRAVKRLAETTESPDFAAAVEAVVAGRPSPGNSPPSSASMQAT